MESSPAKLNVKQRAQSTRIWVTFQKAGIHRYPNAPEDVGYLADSHRHLFKFKVTAEVKHNNRDLEFHQFLGWLEGLYTDKVLSLDHKSCEMMCEELMEQMTDKFGTQRLFEVEVSEDGECGAVLTQF